MLGDDKHIPRKEETMRKLAVVVAAVAALASVPALAAEKGMEQAHQKMKQLMKANPELKKQMMSNPHHVLAMSYVKSLKSFAHGLKMAAKQQETIPGDFLKTSLAEMKRNLDEAEKHHKEFLASLPEETKKKLGDMPKMMEEHAANVRTHIGHLEQMAAAEKVDSKEVLKHLELMMPGCDGMDKMHDHGGKKMKKKAK